MWRRGEAAVRRKRKNLANMDQQSSRLGLDCYPTTVRNANLETASVVLERQRDPTEVHVCSNAGTILIDFGLRMVADELHHQIRIESGFVSERGWPKPKAYSNVCENVLPDFNAFRQITEDSLAPRDILRPKIWAFETEKGRFIAGSLAFRAEM